MAELSSSAENPQTIWTVGHSTRSLDDFIAMLREHGIRAIVDVRQYPRSRRHPHFNDVSLAKALPDMNINYIPMKSLGGRRKASPESINLGWRNEGFRGFADYMQTHEFEGALDELMVHGTATPSAIMCAEAVPWRCHRSLIADALTARGWNVMNIMSASSAAWHKLTPFARVEQARLWYPDPSQLFP